MPGNIVGIIGARDILEKIEKGEKINCNNVVIDGDLDFDMLNQPTNIISGKFDRKVKSPINIANSKINGYVRLGRTVFEKPITFTKTIFAKDSSFTTSQFNETVTFRDCWFKGKANFSVIDFRDKAYFDESKFNKIADFRGSDFKSNADFSKTEFDKIILFDDSKFGGSINFEGSQLVGDLLFKVTISDPNALSLNQSRFSKIHGRWKYIQTHLIEDDEVYLSLVENYKNLGWFEDADDCYYMYRIYHSSHDPSFDNPFRRLFDLLARFSYGYGIKPERPLILAMIIMLLSGGVFYATHGILKLPINQSASFNEDLLFSVAAFTSGASTLVSTTKDYTSIGLSTYIVTLERFFGWLLFALFLASLGKTIIR